MGSGRPRRAELESRSEVGLPPAVHMAVVDGAAEAVNALLDKPSCPKTPICWAPSTCRPECGARRATPVDERVTRMLVRVRRDEGLALAASLRQAIAVESARHDHDAVRVQIDPLHIG